MIDKNIHSSVSYLMNELPILSDRVNQNLNNYDCDESGEVEYKFNDFGYRASFDYRNLLKKPKIVCIGCSFTEGVGLHEEETWPYLLSKKIGLPFFNLGRTCASHGYVMWQIQNVLQNIQKTNIFVLVPPPGRVMFLRDDRFLDLQSWDLEEPGKSYGRLYKFNDFLLENVCNNNKIHYLKSTEYGWNWPKARDGQHFSKEYQEMITNEFLKLI